MNTDAMNKQAVADFQRELDAAVPGQMVPLPRGMQLNDVPVQQPQNLLTAVERAATNPNVDVVKLRELIAIAREERAYNAELEFNNAMRNAQALIGRVPPDAMNKQTGSEYAKLAALDRVVRPIYTKEGLSLSFTEDEDSPEGFVKLLCYSSHIGGHTRMYRAKVPADGKGPKGNDVQTKTHAFGSGFTYGKRQLIKAIFNIAEGKDSKEDDDGNGAGGNETSAIDAVYDKIELAQSVAELKKVQTDVEGAAGKDKRNLIATFNARMRKLKAEAANAQS